MSQLHPVTFIRAAKLVGHLQMVHGRSASTTSQLPGQVATTCTITMTQLHITRTQFALYPSTPAGVRYMSTSVAASGAAPRSCSMFPTDRTVSWLVGSLTSLFSTNMAISETKGQGWRVILT